jgi:hypothetical protein
LAQDDDDAETPAAPSRHLSLVTAIYRWQSQTSARVFPWFEPFDLIDVVASVDWLVSDNRGRQRRANPDDRAASVAAA